MLRINRKQKLYDLDEDEDSDPDRGPSDSKKRTRKSGSSDLEETPADNQGNEKVVAAEEDEEAATEARMLDVLDRSRPTHLPASTLLQFKRCPDANREMVAKLTLTSTEFSPRHKLMMAASTDTSLAFFQVDGEENKLVSSRIFERFPIKCARFTPDGGRVVLASKFRTFRVFDLEKEQCLSIPNLIGVERSQKLELCEVSPDGSRMALVGKFGTMYIVDARTWDKIGQLQTSGQIASICFSHNGDYLCAYGSEATVFMYDMRQLGGQGRFASRWVDEGSTGGWSIAASPDNQWIACGSDSGSVNLYRRADCELSESPRPVKTVNNLLCGCNLLKFNSTSELLGMASSNECRALRLLHVGSRQTFSNFPGRSEDLVMPTSLDFSPGGGFCAVGQRNGRAALYRFHHYEDY